MGQPVVHFEFWTKSPERLSDFYRSAFGWDIRHIPEMKYWLTNSGQKTGINGGIFSPQEGTWPGNVCLYIDVPNLGDAVAQVRSAGGTMIVERQDVPGMGAFALFTDPDGRVNGIWEQTAMAKPQARPKRRVKKGSARRRPTRRPRR